MIRSLSMARGHPERNLSNEDQHRVDRLASEHGAAREATVRSLQYLARGLPSLQASSSKISPRMRLAFAFEILENAYSALGRLMVSRASVRHTDAPWSLRDAADTTRALKSCVNHHRFLLSADEHDIGGRFVDAERR
jgi:hypothetical protein